MDTCEFNHRGSSRDFSYVMVGASLLRSTIIKTALEPPVPTVVAASRGTVMRTYYCMQMYSDTNIMRYDAIHCSLKVRFDDQAKRQLLSGLNCGISRTMMKT